MSRKTEELKLVSSINCKKTKIRFFTKLYATKHKILSSLIWLLITFYYSEMCILLVLCKNEVFTDDI